MNPSLDSRQQLLQRLFGLRRRRLFIELTLAASIGATFAIALLAVVVGLEAVFYLPSAWRLGLLGSIAVFSTVLPGWMIVGAARKRGIALWSRDRRPYMNPFFA